MLSYLPNIDYNKRLGYTQKTNLPFQLFSNVRSENAQLIPLRHGFSIQSLEQADHSYCQAVTHEMCNVRSCSPRFSKGHKMFDAFVTENQRTNLINKIANIL